MTISATAALLALSSAAALPHIVKMVEGSAGEAIKAFLGKRNADRDEAHKTRDELRADLTAARAEIARVKAELATSEVGENAWRDKYFQTQKEYLELLRINVNLDTDLKAVLKGGLTKL